MKRIILIIAWGIAFYIVSLGITTLLVLLFFFSLIEQGKEPLENPGRTIDIGLLIVVAPMIGGLLGSALAFLGILPRRK